MPLKRDGGGGMKGAESLGLTLIICNIVVTIFCLFYHIFYIWNKTRRWGFCMSFYSHVLQRGKGKTMREKKDVSI